MQLIGKIMPLYYPNFPTEDDMKNPEEVKAFLEEMPQRLENGAQKVWQPEQKSLTEQEHEVVDGKTILGGPSSFLSRSKGA